MIDSNPAFEIFVPPHDSEELPAGEVILVDITFTPPALGYCNETLRIVSNDRETPLLDLPLFGSGVEALPLDEILEFFDESEAAGALVGTGPGESAGNRLNALRNMLEEAAMFIEGGFYAEACDQVLAAYGKCDGEPRPDDFVSGDAADDLADMIWDQIEILACP